MRRERLLSRLAEGWSFGKRITVVVGGPGTGKTTLLADYARTVSCRVFWYCVTQADRDPVALAEHLLAGFGALGPGLSTQPAEVLRALGRAGLPQAFDVLCDELSGLPESPLVVLDDVHNLGADDDTAAGLDALARFFPESGQIVMAGRSIPGIKLAGLRLRGQTVEISETDLAFSAEEIAALLIDSTGTPLSDDLAPDLFSRTRGWATGVIYGLHSGTGRPLESLAKPELLYAYLSEELLQGETAALVHALMPYSFLPRVALSSAGGGIASGLGARLDSLRGFASREGDDLVLNPIFREWLQHEFITTRADAEKTVVFRALADRSGPEEAIRLLLMAGDPAAAERRLVGAFASWLQDRHDATIAAALDSFPENLRERSPWLLAIDGELLRRSGQAGRSLERLGQAETKARAAGDRASLAAVLASVAAVHGALGEVERQMAAAREAIDELRPGFADLHSSAPGSAYLLGLACNVLAMGHVARGEVDLGEVAFKDALEAYRVAGDSGGRVRVLHNWGLAHARTGEFERAIATYREAVRAAETAGQLPLAMTCNNLGLCLQYLGRPQEAWDAAERGMVIAERLGGRRDRVFLLWTLGLLSLHRGEALKARDYFETSLAEAGPLGDTLSEVNALAGLAEVALAQKDLAAAQHCLDRAVAAAGSTLEDPALLEAATLQVEVDIGRGDLDAASARLDRLAAAVSTAPNAYHEFHLARLQGAAAAARGDTSGASTWADRLSALSARYGYPPPHSADSDAPPSISVPGRPTRTPGAPTPVPGSPTQEPGGLTQPPGAPTQAPGAPTPAPGAPTSGSPPHPPGAAPVAPMVRTGIAVDFLGPARVVVEGREVGSKDWRSANARLVLGFLLSTPSGASKEELLDMLYPNEEPDRSAVHVLIGRLRNALEPGSKGKPSRFILFQDGRYRFNQGVHSRYDVAEFRMLLRQARDPGAAAQVRRRSLEGAADLYRGPFLPEFATIPWCQIEGENLRRQAMAAYEALFADAAAADDWERLECYADAALVVEPGFQVAHRAKIVALAMLERYEDAERMARVARDILTRSGAPDLDPDTADLIETVLERRLTVRTARASLPAGDL